MNFSMAAFPVMKPRQLCYLLFWGLILVQSAWAGGSGLNTIVVVNQNSTNSLQLGNDYCELRGVPPQNVLCVTGWTGGSINWTPAQFTNYLLNPLLTLVNTRGLTNQAQFVLLSMDIPYRVTDGNNVNIDRESLMRSQTQLQYQMGVQLVKSQFHTMLTAIKES